MPKSRRLIALLGLSLPGIMLGASLAMAASQTIHADLQETSDGRMIMKTSTERVRAG